MHNASVLFRVLQSPPDKLMEWLRSEGITEPAQRLRAVLDAIDGIMGNLGNVNMQHADANLIKREFTWGANMLRQRVLSVQSGRSVSNATPGAIRCGNGCCKKRINCCRSFEKSGTLTTRRAALRAAWRRGWSRMRSDYTR